MKKIFFSIAVLALLSAGASAQKSVDDELNSELDKLYEQSKTPAVNPTAAQASPSVSVRAMPAQTVAPAAPVISSVAPAVPVAVVPTTTAVAPAPAMQSVTVTVPQVQKQAVTVIEATPLVESKVDQLRKARQESELVTEQKIVEKLETSRMEDEKRRAEVLFGDRFNTLANNSSQNSLVAAAPVALAAPVVAAPVAVVPAPAPVVVAAPVVASEVPEKKEDKISREDVRQEITTALDEARIKDEAKKAQKKTFFSVLGGMGDYQNNNITGQYSLGVGVGQKINDRLLVEGQFGYADYHIQNGDGLLLNGIFYPRVSNMEQYTGLLSVKYQLLGGSFRPNVGVAAAYTYRHYNDIQFGNMNDTGSSHAFDLGIAGGADLELSENFALGLEVRYLWNVMNRRQADNVLTPSHVYLGNAVTPENMGNMNIGLTGRMTF